MNQPLTTWPHETEWQGQIIEQFIDTTHTFDFDGYDHSMTPIGNGERTSLTLRRDGSMQLIMEEYDPYSGYIVLSTVTIHGQWELRSLQPERFVISIHEPQVEIVAGIKDTKPLLAQLQQNCVHVTLNGIWYAPCPKEG